MNELNYPLLFHPIFKEKIWGGNQLNSELQKKSPYQKTGESWEISAVKGNESIIKNGDLKGKTLGDLCRKYPLELMGKPLFEKFGAEFPLLIKFLDAQLELSVQVHPDDQKAALLDSFGKNEMWYILNSDHESLIYLGWKQNESKASIKKAMEENTLMDKIQTYRPQKGDAFNVPAGTVHAIGKGILLAEVQQTSDITYRMFDWNRTDEKGNTRDLHISQSLEVINYNATPNLYYPKSAEDEGELIHNPYFKVDTIGINGSIIKNTTTFNSFVIYMCVEGEVDIVSEMGKTSITKGDTTLLPYALGDFQLKGENTKLVEIWV